MKFLPVALLPVVCLTGLTQTARADSVDDLIIREMSSHGIPGAALKIIQNGLTVKTACYGFANIELAVPVTTNTVFEIGSMTKQFTATCILLLQQEGKLSVEDRISRYLPHTPPAWTNITIRHLLTHTSGSRSYTGLDGFEWRRHLTQEQFIRALGRQPLDFPPGDSWKYSNSGYNLLGYVVENVSGTNFWQFLQTQVFDPVGMKSSVDRNPSSIITNRAAGYEKTNHYCINRDYDLTDVFAAGALVSNVEDLANWSTALDATNILHADSKSLMWRPQLLKDGRTTNYGFGWFIETVGGRHVIGHGGSTSGFSASIQRFQDENLTVVLLTNTDEMLATSLARKVAMLQLEHP
jgi:D-alanyl-D-alanine carboxypeptidase